MWELHGRMHSIGEHESPVLPEIIMKHVRTKLLMHNSRGPADLLLSPNLRNDLVRERPSNSYQGYELLASLLVPILFTSRSGFEYSKVIVRS